ncbi:glycosyl hydrolase, family 31 [Clostridiales bacterium oral taxon 876 str. F0540]|nr:glycosyl hydrolase, family 31 [Clostridiales bacterium oral taxon 876 str. F0540]
MYYGGIKVKKVKKILSTATAFIMLCVTVLSSMPVKAMEDTSMVTQDSSSIVINKTNYKIVITKEGFKYAFKDQDGSTIADAHPVSGLRFTAPGGTELYDARTTSLIAYNDKEIHMLVTNTNGNEADVYIYPNESFVKYKIVPRVQEGGNSGNIEPTEESVFVGTNNAAEGLTWAGDKSWTDYSVEGKVKPSNAIIGSSASGLLFRYKDVNNYYHLRLNSGGKLELFKKENGVTTFLKQLDEKINKDTWYKLKAEIAGSTIKCYLNDIEKINITDSGSGITSGAIGLRTYKDTCSFDDIAVKSDSKILLSDDFQNGGTASWNKVSGSWTIKSSTIAKPTKVIIDARTASMGPVYGLGDQGGYGSSTNVSGISNSDFHDSDNAMRFESNFAVFPAQKFAEVLFEDGKKRVFINNNENTLGAANVDNVSSLYYFMGSMEQIYKDYKAARINEGYPDYKPKYEFFEVGYEAFGSLGWNTYQQSVTNDLKSYIDKGYNLKWGVIGSGFWKGDRNKDNQGCTTSFGLWDDTYDSSGRTDGLPNPRYPDVQGLKQFFSSNGIKLMLGLRTNFKATAADGGNYNPSNDGSFPLDGLKNGYFMKDSSGKVSTFNVNFPKGKVYLLDNKNPQAVNWYKSLVDTWGADGFKEDTMLGDGSQLYNDAKANQTNGKLMESGYYVMVRKSSYSVPGDIIRLEDTQYGSDQDRPVINGLNYAASAAPNFYPDIVGGKYLPNTLTADQKEYFVRNAMFAAVSPAMSMGLGPWKMNNAQYEAIVKKAADWHAKFAPYIYSAAVDSFNTGYPYTMTPLPIAFSSDANTYNLANKTTKQYEWMLGPSMLVTPVYGSDYASAASRDVYLPEGKWMDYETGEVYYGPKVLKNFSLPKDKIPVFIGGKGTVVLQDSEVNKFYAKVYPIANKGSQYKYTYTDGSTTSTITNDNIGWNPSNMVIKDVTANTNVEFNYEDKTDSFKFQLTPGHDYKLLGGNPISIKAPFNNQIIKELPFTISGTSAKTSNINLTIGEQSIQVKPAEDGSWNYDIKDLTDGKYTIKAAAESYYGNAEEAVDITLDRTAPITKAEIDGIKGDGWFLSDISILLNAEDNISGVASTEYKLGGSEDWIDYTKPISITEEGAHQIQYRSIDKAGNIEETKTETIRLDKSKPTFMLLADGKQLSEGSSFEDSQPLTFKVEDNLSGVAEAKIDIGGEVYTIDKDKLLINIDMAGKIGDFSAKITVKDYAGNSLETVVPFNVTTSIKSMKTLIERYKKSNELGGALSSQLINSLDQTQHQIDKGRPNQAANHMDNFIKHLNNKALENQAQDRVKAVLNVDANFMIENLLGKK